MGSCDNHWPFGYMSGLLPTVPSCLSGVPRIPFSKLGEQPCFPRAPTTKDPQRAGTFPAQPVRDQHPRQCLCPRPGSSKLSSPNKKSPGYFLRAGWGTEPPPSPVFGKRWAEGWKDGWREVDGGRERDGGQPEQWRAASRTKAELCVSPDWWLLASGSWQWAS